MVRLMKVRGMLRKLESVLLKTSSSYKSIALLPDIKKLYLPGLSTITEVFINSLNLTFWTVYKKLLIDSS